MFQAVGRALRPVGNAVKNFFSAVATIIVAAMVGCLSLGVVAVIALLLYGLVVIVYLFPRIQARS